MRNVFLAILLTCTTPLTALEETQLQWESNGPSVQEYNGLLQSAILSGDWWAVIDYAELISYNFPASPFAKEASYLMGEAYYKLEQFEPANECFTAYLNYITSPKHFEQAIEYKFNIAERFAAGTKKRLFSSVKMPAWVEAEEDSIPIYEEVIASMPYSDFAAKSMLGKARVQTSMEEFKLAAETLDLLIRRFPKHDLAAEAFLEKNKIYLQQCKIESLDLDLLDVAGVNLRKFRTAFPRENRLSEAEQIFADMQELYAGNLLETGLFFEKTKKMPASILYFNKVISQYPDTKAAQVSREKLETLSI